MQCDFKHLGIEIFSSLPIVITSESCSNSGTCKSKLQILSWLFVEGNWLRRWEECFGRWVNKYWEATLILFLISHNHYIHYILFGLDWIGRKKMTTHHTTHKKKIGTIFVEPERNVFSNPKNLAVFISWPLENGAVLGWWGPVSLSSIRS